jgi:hypothetical protein
LSGYTSNNLERTQHATVRTMQPTFPPAPELRPPSSEADTSDVKAFDSVSWEELITPLNLATIREVPSELQGDLLDAMRDVLQHLNDALQWRAPKSNSNAGTSFGCCFPFCQCSYEHRRAGDDEAMD